MSKEVILCINQGEATSFTLNTDSGFAKIFTKGDQNYNFRVSIIGTVKLGDKGLFGHPKIVPYHYEVAIVIWSQEMVP